MEILLIEDNPQDARQIQAALEMAGPARYRTHVVDCLSKGVAAAQGRSAFDAVVLDLDLPDSSGVETLVDFKSAHPLLPLIVLCEADNFAQVHSIMQHGVYGIINKTSVVWGRLARTIYFTVIKNKREKDIGSKESRYRTVIETMKDAYYEIDFESKFSYVNDAVLEHLGRSREELIGMHNREYNPPDVAKRMHGAFTEVYRTGKSGKVVENVLVRPDGSLTEVEVRISLLRDDVGNPVCFSGISRDITEQRATQRALQESKDKYETILNSIEDTYFEVDLKGHMLFLNRSSEGLYGYSFEELQKSDNRMYMTDETAGYVFNAYREIYKTGRSNPSLQYEIINKEGKPAYIESSISLMRDADGHPIGFRGVGRFITERKAKELELIIAKEKAEQATQAKSDFLANMSHEIRTPMNGIIGMYTLLQSTALTPEQSEYVKTGKRSADALLTIINDILDFSKIEAGKLDVEMIDFNLRIVIEEMVALPATQAHSKGLEFLFHIDHEVPSLLKGDPARLRQIILNLTTNAVKFCEKGEVGLYITLENESDSRVALRFVVKDTGIGIAEVDQVRLFKSFQQVDNSTTRKYGGTGLGLAIARRLTDLMGGRMGVESVLGQGATFWFVIAFEKISGRSEPGLIAPESVRDKRILIVDDNTTNLDILESYLKGWGCGCDRASNAATALLLMKAVKKVGAPYDLVISDMLMPEVDGAELGRRIKADSELKDTLMIMLTSQGLRGDGARMRQIGFSAYLTKPVRPVHLFDCILSVLNQKKEVCKEKTSTRLITNYSLSEDKRGRIKILLVEDNAINRKLVIHLLEHFGFQSQAVFNGKEAIEALSVGIYDIVLMDIEMPEMDGFEATRLIRNPASMVIDHQVPIIAMTAHASASDHHACLAAGMDDYISKPIRPEAFLQVVEKCIKDHRKSD